ncbi:MAG: hydroxymethylbilane synthase [Acidimicrobiia bacterium]
MFPEKPRRWLKPWLTCSNWTRRSRETESAVRSELGPVALIRLLSRKSNLALIQAREVQAAIRNVDPSVQVEIVTVTSAGERAPDRRIEEFDTTGVFTKALEEALIEGAGDAAVHSAKDLPTILEDRFEIAAYLRRGDRRDALVIRSDQDNGKGHRSLDSRWEGYEEGQGGFLESALSVGALVATGSVRRRAQLSKLRPDLTFMDLRGNMERRLESLRKCDGVVAGACALDRLGISEGGRSHLKILRLHEEVVVPAAGQGAIAVESLRGDTFADLWAGISDKMTAVEVAAERFFLRGLRAGCTAPVGVTAHLLEDNTVSITSVVCSRDGHRSLKVRYRLGSVEEAVKGGDELASEASEIWATDACLPE